MGSSIRRQRPTYVHFLLEVVPIVTADLPLVALMWLNQLSLDAIMVCSSYLAALSSEFVERATVDQRREVG
jgi:hypothetical protein